MDGWAAARAVAEVRAQVEPSLDALRLRSDVISPIKILSLQEDDSDDDGEEAAAALFGKVLFAPQLLIE